MQFSIGLVHPPIARVLNILEGLSRAIAVELYIFFAAFLSAIRALRPSLNYYYKSNHAPSEFLF
jgi:hypothetical protein